MNRALKLLIAALLLPAASLSLSACIHTMGPAEKAGADMDKTLGTDRKGRDGPLENTGERIDKADGQSKDNNDSPNR